MEESDPDLRDLLMGWLGHDLPHDRCEALLARLDRDLSFREQVAQEIKLLGMIRAAQASEPRWLELEEELGMPLGRSVSDTRFADELMDRLPSRHPARPRLRAWLAAAAVVLLALALGLFLRRSPAPVATNVSPQTRPASVAVVPPVMLGTVARIEKANWETVTLTEGGALAAGEYRLASGRAVFSLFNGATIVLEGPARVELVSLDRMVCWTGKLRTHVPPSAQGFTVVSPAAAVVDLGTEFGLSVDAQGRSKVMVFEGQAEISSLNDDGSSLTSVQLQQDQAVSVDRASRKIDDIVADTHEYAAAVSDPDVPLTLSPEYAQAVRASSPWGYWRFESAEDGRTPNDIAGNPPLSIHGGLKIRENPGGNHSILFPRADAGQYLLMEGAWSVPSGSGYAIEFWILAKNINSSSVVALVSAREGAGPNSHTALIELTARPRELLHKPAAVRFLHRQPPGSSGGTNVFSKLPYVPYRWYHVVAQRSGPALELYIDGQRSGQAPLDDSKPATETEAVRLLIGRLATAELKGIGVTRSFIGQLDELSVYNRSLTSEQIRHHFQAAGQLPR